MSADANTAELFPADRTVVITRAFDAPARVLFQAFSECRHIRRWFGPVGWPVTLCEIDFRVGGRFRFAMTGPGGDQNTPFGGTYLEIVPDRKIVYDNGFESPGAERMVVTLTLEEEGGRTALTHHTVFASPAMYDAHVGAGFVQGTGSGLDQLADLAVEMAAQG